MTDDDKRQEDSDWLKDAFDRALRGDNGVAPDAARPAANPFGVTPTPEQEETVRHNELDLDFETESTVPPQAFLPVVDFGDEPAADDNEPDPDPFAVFAFNDSETQTEPTDIVDIPESAEAPEPTAPLIQPTASAAQEHVEANPTEALDVVDAPTVIAPLAEPPVEPTPNSSVDGLDALFGEDKFSEATTALISPPVPADTVHIAREPEVAVADVAPKPAPKGRPNNAVVYGIAGGLALLLGIGGFVLGSMVGGGTASPTPTPTKEAEATAIREPGTWAWNQLFGGECIDPFPGAWAESFEVVDCVTPHAAQLVAVGDLAEGTGTTFPGAEQAAALAQTACSAQGVLDLATAGAYPNLQISLAYAPTQEQWDAGDTKYYCFVTLADASSITGSIAGAGAETTE